MFVFRRACRRMYVQRNTCMCIPLTICGIPPTIPLPLKSHTSGREVYLMNKWTRL